MNKRLILLLGVFISLVSFAKVPKCNHVILIGADGFTSEVLRENPGRYKNIEKMMKSGCWTLTSRSVLPSSSAINWSSMLKGVGCEMHGFIEWNSKKPDFDASETSHWGMFPTIFGTIRDQMPKAETGAIYSWDGIGYIYEQKSTSYNVYTKAEDDAEVTRKAVEYIKNKRPDFLFVYFSNPDETGHRDGWLSKEYNAACDSVDKYVGILMNTINETFDAKKTAVMFSSDHGGINKGHGGKTLREMETPLIIVNPKLPQNHKIDYPVMRYDTAPTIAQLLGVKSPDVWRGKSALRNIK